MEMHQIRYFLAVARTLNFTRAAEECNVSQPSLTRAIKLLEEELGGDLFRRERNLSHLTDLGERVRPLIQQCYDTALGAKSLAQSIRKGEVATLRLAIARSIDLSLLIPFLRELLRAMQGLELKFVRGSSAEIAEAMKQGDADIALAATVETSWDRFDARPLFTEGFRLLVGSGHALASGGPASLERIAGARVLRRPYCEHAEQLAALLRSRDIMLASPHEVASDEDAMTLIKENLAVAIGPASTPVGDGILSLPLADLDLERTVSVYTVAGRPRSTAAATLLRQLLAADWGALRR
jgi:DNA-binding transcriptional LysR family regulator